MTIVVDVANVMGSRPDGWWRDRAGAAVRLHDQIVRLAASGRAILPADASSPHAGASSPDARVGSPGAGAGSPDADAGAGSPDAGAGSKDADGGSPDADAGAGSPDAGGGSQADGTGRPGFVLVLEGAANAAVARLPRAESGAPGLVRPGEVRVVQARGSGDDAIVAVVRELPGRRVVVTADRELRARSVAAGAEILGPGWLLGLLRD